MGYQVVHPLPGNLRRGEFVERWSHICDTYAFKADHNTAPDFRIRLLTQATETYTLTHWIKHGDYTMTRDPHHIRASDPDHVVFTAPLYGGQTGSVDGTTFTSGRAGMLWTPEGHQEMIKCIVDDPQTAGAQGFSFAPSRAAMAHRLGSPVCSPINTSIMMDSGLGVVVSSIAVGLLRARDQITATEFTAACDTMADLIAMSILRDDRPDIPECLDISVEVIRKHIRKHVGGPVSLATASRDLGWSQRRIQTALSMAGTTWRRVVQEERLERARDMLRQPPTPRTGIAEIARACGYQSENAFSAAHRARYGETPRDYKYRAALLTTDGVLPRISLPTTNDSPHISLPSSELAPPPAAHSETPHRPKPAGRRDCGGGVRARSRAWGCHASCRAGAQARHTHR